MITKNRIGDTYLCLCLNCKEFFIGRVFRHRMYMCPTCKKNGVDIEESYARLVGNCKMVKKINLTKADIKKIENYYIPVDMDTLPMPPDIYD